MERVARGRPPIAAAGVAVVIGGLAIAGLVGSPASRTLSLAQQARPAIEAVLDPGYPEAPWRTRPGTDGEPFADAESMARSVLAMDARRTGRLISVRGDVFTRRAVVVIVSIEDARNRTLDIRSVDLLRGATAFGTAPTGRFSFTYKLGGSPTLQPAWAMANAYDDRGAIIATARVRVGSEGVSRRPFDPSDPWWRGEPDPVGGATTSPPGRTT